MVSFTTRPFHRRGKSPGNHWIGGWVDPRAGLNDVENRKFLTLPGLEFRTPGLPACSQSLYDCAIPAHTYSRIEIYFHAFLTSALVGASDQLHVPSAIYPERMSPVPAKQDTENIMSCQELNCGHLAYSLYVCTSGGPHPAPAPRPSQVYCASPLISPLSILRFEWNLGLCLWGRRSSHLIPWRTGPRDEIVNKLWPHSHIGRSL
jgi:hypothetical protein